MWFSRSFTGRGVWSLWKSVKCIIREPLWTLLALTNMVRTEKSKHLFHNMREHSGMFLSSRTHVFSFLISFSCLHTLRHVVCLKPWAFVAIPYINVTFINQLWAYIPHCLLLFNYIMGSCPNTFLPCSEFCLSFLNLCFILCLGWCWNNNL